MLLSRELERTAAWESATLDTPGDRSGCKFYALAGFSFSPVPRHMAAPPKAVHYRPLKRLWDTLTLPPAVPALILGYRAAFNGRRQSPERLNFYFRRCEYCGKDCP